MKTVIIISSLPLEYKVLKHILGSKIFQTALFAMLSSPQNMYPFELFTNLKLVDIIFNQNYLPEIMAASITAFTAEWFLRPYLIYEEDAADQAQSVLLGLQ